MDFSEKKELKVTDIMKKAIAFCREKEITFPIANYLVEFATENSIQWHKISEELPKAEIGIHNVETYRVLKLNAYKNPVECYCSYNNRTQKFENVVDTKKSVYWKEIEGVVAWQEIPLVPEEVNAWLYPQIKE